MKQTLAITALALLTVNQGFSTDWEGAATKLSAASKSSYVVTNGSVKAWGLNGNAARLGILHNVTGSSYDTATNVLQHADGSLLTNVKAISGGLSHGLVLLNDGTLKAWGSGDGAVGSTNYALMDGAVPTEGISGVRQISAGYYVSMALGSNGFVYGFGNNAFGQIGTALSSTASRTNVPTQIQGLSDITKVAVGTQHILALKSDGTLWGWGNNSYDRIGTGVPGSEQPTPLQVTSVSNVVTMAAAVGHNLAVTADGNVWAWGIGGAASSGAMGDGFKQPRTNAVLVTDVSYVDTANPWVEVTVITNEPFVYNLTPTNEDNCLTTGQTIQITVQTNYCTNTVFSLQGNVVAVAAGANCSLALTSHGRVFAWGGNGRGQLGIGYAGGVQTNAQPVLDPSGTGYLKNIVAISAAKHDLIGEGTAFCLALDADGRVFAWGDNTKGQLGVSTNTYPDLSFLPVQVHMP